MNQYYAPDEAATAQLLADLGAGLARSGHEVSAVCCDRCYADPELRYPRRDVLDGVSVSRVRATGFGRSRGAAGRLVDYVSFLAGASIALFSGKRPQVLICLSTPPMIAVLGMLVSKIRRSRFVFWVMDVYPELAFRLGVVKPGSVAGRLLGWLSRAPLRRSDRIVALGPSMAVELGRAGAEKVDVVHNWADGETIRPRPIAGHPLRADWGWNDRFVVLYSGNMGLAHEFETLLAVADRLRDDPSILFSFVGGGPRRAEVEREAKRLGLPNVEFRPYAPRSQLDQSLTAGDVHLVTLRERMPGLLVPSKIYGILAAGRPTLYVGPPTGEIAEILREGRCGTLVPSGDAEALLDAIRSYRSEPGRAEREGERARELFDARFARPIALRSFEDLIEGLAGGS